MSMSGNCDAIYSAAKRRWHCSADFSVHNRQIRSMSTGVSPSVAQCRCQIFATVKRNVRACSPQAHVPNSTHAHCIQNLYKPVRAFTTETNCKNLWHISTKIVRLTSNSNDFPASGIFAPALYDNSIKSSNTEFFFHTCYVGNNYI